MRNKISILFYVKRTKVTPDGLVPIYMRITIDGKRLETSTKKFVEPLRWLPKADRVKPGSEDAKTINQYLDVLKNSVYDYEIELIKMGSKVNTENMLNKLLGVDQRIISLVQVFTDHNNKVKALLGKEFASGTLERYKTSLKHTVDFLKWKFNVTDIDIRSINHAFITEYEFYLRSVRNCNNNSAIKYIKNFGKIIRICLANGWLDKNPFANYKAKVKEVERVFLNDGELKTILNWAFDTLSLNQVRDIFVFSCYTGLAYADVKQLDNTQLVKGIDGGNWIILHRQKTETRSSIPLLPIAQDILNKYASNPRCLNSGKLK
jgi:hypothetical protein